MAGVKKLPVYRAFDAEAHHETKHSANADPSRGTVHQTSGRACSPAGTEICQNEIWFGLREKQMPQAIRDKQMCR